MSQEGNSDAAVGSISHILHTAFKDDYDERKKILEAKEKKLMREKKLREIEEKKRIYEEELRAEEERLAAEAVANKKNAKKMESKQISQDEIDKLAHEREELLLSSDPEDNTYQNPIDELPLSENHQKMLHERIQNIQNNLQTSSHNAENLVNYLTKQRDLARQQEIIEEENLKKQGIMIGQHIPSLVSKLEINPEVLQNFGNYSSNLIITRDLIQQNYQKNLRRTGNLPISEEMEEKLKSRKLNKTMQLHDTSTPNEGGGDPPHPNYLQSTDVIRERTKVTKSKFVTFLTKHEQEIQKKKLETGLIALPGPGTGQGTGNGNEEIKVKKVQIPKRDYGQSAIEKEQDQQILKTIQHKLNYLRNPRNSPNMVNRTLIAKRSASSPSSSPSLAKGFGKQASSHSSGHSNYPPLPPPSGVAAPASSSSSAAASYSSASSSSAQPSSHRGLNSLSTVSKTGSSLFLTEPSVIIFNSYDVGQKYTASISFRNISSISRSLRVIPPATSHFSLAPLQYPSHSKGGMVAPGMVIISEISFFPQSLCDYADIIHVETEGGSYTVPLYGKRNPPQLSLPSLIDIGSCLVGDALRTSISCTNNGGKGKFKLLKQEWYPVIPEEVDYFGCIRCFPFTLYPLEFELNKYETTQITVEFIPIEIKIYQVNFVILFDNEQYITVALQGEGKEINCKIVEINSISLIPNTPSATTGPGLGHGLGPGAGAVTAITKSKQLEKTLVKDLFFHNCFIGSEYEQEIMISNTTGLSIEFEWVWVESKAKDIKMNALHKLMIQDEQQEEKIEEKVQQQLTARKKKNEGKLSKRRGSASAGAGAGTGLGTGTGTDLLGTSAGIEDDLVSTHDFSMDFEDKSSSSMGGYCITPGRGVFSSYGTSPFIVKFRPSSNEIESGRLVLILRDVTEASLCGPQQELALRTLLKKKHGPYYRLQSWFDEIGTNISTSQTKNELDDLFLRGLTLQNTVSKRINLETLWNIICNHSGYSLDSYLLITCKYILSRLLSKCYRWHNRNSADREVADDDSIFGGEATDEDEEIANTAATAPATAFTVGENDERNDDEFSRQSNTSLPSTENSSSPLQFHVIYWDPSSASSSSSSAHLEDNQLEENFGQTFPTFSLHLQKEKLFDEDFLDTDELSTSEIPFNITHNLSKYLDIDTAEGRRIRKFIWVSIPTALDILGPILCELLDEKVKHESIDFLQRIARVNLPILDINATGGGIIPSIHLTPALITCGGVLGIGVEWKCQVTIHNTSPIMNEVNIDSSVFHCENMKKKENLQLSFSNSDIILHPNSSEIITVTVIFREIGEFLVNIPVIPASPFVVINDIMIQATVVGPKIRFEAPELNLGLLNTGMESTTILTFTNDTNIPLYYNLSCQLDSSLNNLNSHKRVSSSPSKITSSSFPGGGGGGVGSNRDRDDDTHSVAHSARSQMTENSSDSYAIENATAMISFDPPTGTLSNGEICQVKVKCIGGKFPQRIKGVIECAITDISRLSSSIPSQYLSIRGEVQSPLTILYPTHLDLGNVYVNTPIHFQITLKNLTSLPSKFKFDRPGGDSAAYRLKYSEKSGELEGKETRVIEVEYTALITGVTDDVLACKIFGLSTPLGYQLKSISKGIQVEFIPLDVNQIPPEPLAPSHEPQYPGPGPVPDPTPTKPLDFTTSVTLYERVVRRFALRNLSAMMVNYELKPRKYDVGEIFQHGEEGEDGDDEISITSSLKEPPVSGQGRLIPKEDGENRFHSQEGKKYIGSILKRRQDKHYLTLGLGASYTFEPKNGTIKPWDVVVVTVLSRNDMPGCFDDDIICDIKDHRKLYFPMKMTVIGCPLIIERDSYGMSTYSPENEDKSTETKSSLMLQMGSSTVNSEAIVREFRVRNNGSSPATIKWKLRSVSSKVNGPIKFELKVDRIGTKFGVKSNFLFWDDVAKDSPFEVEPKSTTIPPYSRKNFKVKFFRTSQCVNELALLTGGISFDMTDGNEIRSQTTSRANLHDETNSIGSRSPQGGGSGGGGGGGGGGGSTANYSNSVDLMTRTSKPSYNISLFLKANIMFPEIKVDQNTLTTSNQKITHATSHPIILKTDAPQLYSRDGNGGGGGSGGGEGKNGNSLCKRVVVLTNPIPAVLAFSVSIEGPFTVKYLQDEGTNRSSSSGSNNGGNGSSVGSTCVLQSHASSRFVISFIPKKELRNTLLQNTSLTGHDANKKELVVDNEKGVLIISFSTGQQIYIPINVVIATPYLTASSPRLFYGTCHVTKSCQGVILLSNPTNVTARWSVAHVPNTNKSKKVSSIRVKGFDVQTETEDDPTVFEITPQSGEVAGPTVSPTATTYCPPNDFNRSPTMAIIEQRPIETSWKTNKLTMKDSLVTRYETSYQHAIDARYPLPIQIQFKPKRSTHYCSRYRFICEFGNIFDVLVEGKGTYEEHEHSPINPNPR